MEGKISANSALCRKLLSYMIRCWVFNYSGVAEFSSFRPICGTQLCEQEPPNHSSVLPRVIRRNLTYICQPARSRRKSASSCCLSSLRIMQISQRLLWRPVDVEFVEEEWLTFFSQPASRRKAASSWLSWFLACVWQGKCRKAFVTSCGCEVRGRRMLDCCSNTAHQAAGAAAVSACWSAHAIGLDRL